MQISHLLQITEPYSSNLKDSKNLLKNIKKRGCGADALRLTLCSLPIKGKKCMGHNEID